MDSHTFVHVVSKWPALRLSNQCSFMFCFFFSNKTDYNQKVEFSFPYFCSLLKGVSVR